MRPQSGPKGKRLLTAVIAIIIVAVPLALAIQRYHKVPIERALNPVFWIQHLRGEDRYIESQALLEHGDPSRKEVAITIDDGPDPRYGPAIAKYLHDNHVAATFFLVGIRVKQYPAVAKLIAADGFDIGNHTYDHQRLPALKSHEIASELRLCAQHIKDVTGRDVHLMRPPGVQYNDKVLDIAKSQGYVTVSWTCGAQDYDTHPASYIAQRVLDRTEPGSIIILHQDQPSTIEALPIIIDKLRSQGYSFVTISEMLDHLHAKLPSKSVAG
jgi:peptidoglycan/xylan/chitin deacetylase (PgdA/CDA1 family)